MRALILKAAALTAALAVCGCATHQTAKSDAAQSLATTSHFAAERTSEQSGRNSYGWGDKYTAANLLLQADQADNTITNRFNLATAYAAIGKTDAASEIYGSLVVDGQYTRLSEDVNEGQAVLTKSFNVSDESRRRMQLLSARVPGPTGAIGVSGTGETNEQARIIDQNAEDERARYSR